MSIIIVVGKVRIENGARFSGLKGLSPGFITEDTVISSFENEAQLLAYLRRELNVERFRRERMTKYPNSVILRPEIDSRVVFLVVFSMEDFMKWSDGSFAQVKL